MNKNVEIPVEVRDWYNASRIYAISYLAVWDEKATEENIAMVIRRSWLKGEGYDLTDGLMLPAREAAAAIGFDVYQFINHGAL